MRRHETASTLITTNRPTQDWGVFLGDVPAATAIPDQLPGASGPRPMTGKGYRLRQRTNSPTTEAVGAAGPVDAQTAPTGPRKAADGFPQAPTGSLVCAETEDQDLPRLRASEESDNTQTTTFRVALLKRSSVAAFERSVTYSERADDRRRLVLGALQNTTPASTSLSSSRSEHPRPQSVCRLPELIDAAVGWK